MTVILIIIVAYVIRILFCVSYYKTITVVPNEHHIFPAWFIWMTLIPFVGYVFEWLMLPFGLPTAIKHFLPNDDAVKKENDTLFGIGLAHAIVGLGLIFMNSILLFIIVAVRLILLIIYWVKLVKIRQPLIQSVSIQQATKPIN